MNSISPTLGAVSTLYLSHARSTAQQSHEKESLTSEPSSSIPQEDTVEISSQAELLSAETYGFSGTLPGPYFPEPVDINPPPNPDPDDGGS